MKVSKTGVRTYNVVSRKLDLSMLRSVHLIAVSRPILVVPCPDLHQDQEVDGTTSNNYRTFWNGAESDRAD